MAKSLIVRDPLRGFDKDFIKMNSFLKFHVIERTKIDLFGIVQFFQAFYTLLFDKSMAVVCLGNEGKYCKF